MYSIATNLTSLGETTLPMRYLKSIPNRTNEAVSMRRRIILFSIMLPTHKIPL